jgi:hypothetical protein
VTRLLRPIPLIGTGLGAAVGLLFGADPVSGVIGGAIGIGAGVLVERRRDNPRPARIDPFTLVDPWRRAVKDALKAQARFREAVGRSGAGPVRDRLGAIGERLDESVEACWRIARHGQAMGDARRGIDVRELEAEAASLRDDGPDTDHHGPTAAALNGQLDTARRLDRVIDDTRSRLRLLNARLDETVARALELSARSDRAAALDPVAEDVEDVADELEALRLALDETDGLDRPPG